MGNWSISTTEDFNNQSFSISISDISSFALQNPSGDFELQNFEGNTYEEDIKNYFDNDVEDLQFVMRIAVETGVGVSGTITINSAQVFALSIAHTPKNCAIIITNQNGIMNHASKSKGKLKTKGFDID